MHILIEKKCKAGLSFKESDNEKSNRDGYFAAAMERSSWLFSLNHNMSALKNNILLNTDSILIAAFHIHLILVHPEWQSHNSTRYSKCNMI